MFKKECNNTTVAMLVNTIQKNQKIRDEKIETYKHI